MNEKWVTIYTFYDILEGKELEAILKDNSILAKLISRQDSAFDGVFKQSVGEGIIQVREESVTKANEIINDFKKHREEIAKAAEEESKVFKDRAYKEVHDKNKNLYSSIKIIFIILLIGLAVFAAKNLFMPERLSGYKELINEYKKAIRINPNDATAYENLGYVFFQLGYYHRAVPYYKKAINIKPDSIRYSGLGASYAEAGNFKEAISALKKAIELDSKGELNYINLGKAYREIGEYQLAISNFQEALRLNPKNASAYNGLSAVYYYIKDFNKMLEYSLKEIELNPKSHSGYYNSGLAYLKLKSYRDAIVYFEKAIANDPKYAEAYFNLGVIYKEMGDKTLLRKQYDKLLELNRKDLADRIANRIEGVEYPSKHIIKF